MEENSVWKSCITAKCGTEDGGWFTPLPKGSYVVGLWKIITKESGQLKKDRVFKLEDCRKIRFWEDNWCGRASLREAFPDLYSIVGTKGAMAADLWVEQGGLGAWDPKFMRPFNDWEMDAIQAFIGLTSNSFITLMVKD